MKQNKKKVLCVLYDNFGFGGLQTVFLNIVRILHYEYQFDFILFESGSGIYEQEILSYGCRLFYISHYEGNFTIFKRADFYIRGRHIYRCIFKIMKENGPYDVIHCNKALESGLCVKAAYKCAVPVRIVHSHVNFRASSFPRSLWDKYYRMLIGKYATNNIGCSKEACHSLFRDLSSQIVYNPYNDAAFTFQPLNKHMDKIILTQVGSYSDNKNQVFSIHILRKIFDLGKRAELRLIGFDPVQYGNQIKKEMNHLHLEDNVVLLPGDTDIPAVLNETNACLFPSHFEGFGIVMIEAQAAGVCCYASNMVPAEVDVGGVTFLALEDGPQIWAERIIEDYEKTGGEHVRYDCSIFSISAVAQVYRKLYEGY